MGESPADAPFPPSKRKRVEDGDTYGARALTAAQRSRKNQTVGERKLWEALRKLKLNIRRQAPIGDYVADFACHSARLVVEVDGYYHTLPARQLRDAARDAWLRSKGYRVVRFTDREAELRTDEVVEKIERMILRALPPRRGKGWDGGVETGVQAEPPFGAGADLGSSGHLSDTPPTPAHPPSRGKGGLNDRVMSVLRDVPDPEIPAVTIVDLGIIRGVYENPPRVLITPTYTGCPATIAIQGMIRKALDEAGFKQVDIVTVIDPAWTTDWISEEGREKLRAYGIAPPPKGAASHSLKADTAECPRCASTHTEEISRFGSTPCKAQWRCLDCLEPFDRFKCH